MASLAHAHPVVVIPGQGAVDADLAQEGYILADFGNDECDTEPVVIIGTGDTGPVFVSALRGCTLVRTADGQMWDVYGCASDSHITAQHFVAGYTYEFVNDAVQALA